MRPEELGGVERLLDGLPGHEAPNGASHEPDAGQPPLQEAIACHPQEQLAHGPMMARDRPQPMGILSGGPLAQW